jgi:hypothetical protein
MQVEVARKICLGDLWSLSRMIFLCLVGDREEQLGAKWEMSAAAALHVGSLSTLLLIAYRPPLPYL